MLTGKILKKFMYDNELEFEYYKSDKQVVLKVPHGLLEKFTSIISEFLYDDIAQTITERFVTQFYMTDILSYYEIPLKEVFDV